MVTGDWVVIALGRGKRPGEFVKKREAYAPLSDKCPFCFPEETGQEPDVLMYRRGDGDWSLRVFPNKYPAFSRGKAMRHIEEGPYFGMDGVGYHEDYCDAVTIIARLRFLIRWKWRKLSMPIRVVISI